MIGKTIGNLKIVSEIGEGGMGVVYMAEHVTLPKKFAVKCLSPALTRNAHFRDRFYQEAQNQALLDHPNIVQVTDFLETDDFFFLVMEYVDGKELDEHIAEKGKMSEQEVLSIFKDVLNGLNFAHSKGIIHRDIKPPNILVDNSGRVRIMDFGIAILAGDKRLTADGTNIGSPWYMSPEQIKRPKDIDHRSDVYSMGIVLYEMLTGNVPFDGETDFIIKDQHINSPIPDPRKNTEHISKKLAEIILTALEKDPEDRYSGCGEFLEYIKAYEAGDEQKETSFKTFAWAIVIIAVICVLGVFTISYYKDMSTQDKIKQETLAREKAETKAEKAEIASQEAIRKAEIDRKAKEESEKKTEQAKTAEEETARKAEIDRKAKEEAEKQAEQARIAKEKAVREAEQERIKIEHDSAFKLIRRASEKASSISKEIKEIPLKRENLKIAADLGDSGLIDAYKKQIKEKEQNIRDGLSAYDECLKQLADKQQKIVNEEFDNYSNILTQEKSFRQIKIVSAFKRHYNKYLKENKLDNSYYQKDLSKL